MKKVFLLAAFAVMGLTVNAQASFGAKAGVNFSSINGDNSDGASGLTSFHVGGVANIAVSEFFSVQPELVYSLQGYSYETILGDGEVRLNYLNIPLMADFAIAEGLSLQGGPQIGINLSNEAEFEGVSVDFDAAETIEIGAGIGAQYKMANNLFFQARYVTGLTEISKDSGTKNGVVSLSVGYMFN